MDIDFFVSSLIILDKLLAGRPGVLLKEALNHRVEKEGLSIEDAIIEGHKQGKTIKQLLAMPEQDGAMFSDGLSYVCSCFVAAIWKAGGLFEGMEINATEFTPRDVYQIKFFSEEKPRDCLLYTSPSPRDQRGSRMPSSA